MSLKVEKCQKLLSQMVCQYTEAHGTKPEKIVVEPLALAILGIKRSVAPMWDGVPVVTRNIDVSDVALKKGSGTCLGVALNKAGTQLVSFDVK